MANSNTIPPSIEWQWNRVLVHEGALTTQGEIEEMTTVLEFLATRLPPGIKAALDKIERKKGKDGQQEQPNA